MPKKKDNRPYVLKRNQAFYCAEGLWRSGIGGAKQFKTIEEAHEVAKKEFSESKPLIKLYRATEPRFEKVSDDEVVDRFGRKSIFWDGREQHLKECIVCGTVFDRNASDDARARWNKCSRECKEKDQNNDSTHDPDCRFDIYGFISLYRGTIL
jgi:hypothetical protein